MLLNSGTFSKSQLIWRMTRKKFERYKFILEAYQGQLIFFRDLKSFIPSVRRELSSKSSYFSRRRWSLVFQHKIHAHYISSTQNCFADSLNLWAFSNSQVSTLLAQDEERWNICKKSKSYHHNWWMSSLSGFTLLKQIKVILTN